MAKTEKILVTVGSSIIELGDERLAEYKAKIKGFEQYIYWLSHQKTGRSYDDVKSLFAYYKENKIGNEEIKDDISLTQFSCFANDIELAWIEQVYLPNLRKVGICIDEISQEMSEGLRLECEVQVEKLEEDFSDVEMNLFWDVKSYFARCEKEKVHNQFVMEELSELGYNCFAVKPGLAWLMQIYIPKVEASCKRSTSK
jgi:tRNA G26 N,N-dimethylase Trm1